jgi:hypothetical protein
VVSRLLLLLALALAQLGGAAHALSHLRKSPREELPSGAPHHCLVCDAYSCFDHCAAGAAQALPAPQAHPAPPVVSDREPFAAETSPSGIRDPPV